MCAGGLVGAGCEEGGVGGGVLPGRVCVEGRGKGPSGLLGVGFLLGPAVLRDSTQDPLTPPFSFPAERGLSRVVSGAERSQQWRGSRCSVERVRGFLFLNKSVLLVCFSVTVPK